MTSNELRRYTDLAAVLRTLKTRSITLLQPKTWDDRNDRNLMLAYQRRKKYKTALAICFAEAAETYHHWKVFSPGKDGMCVVFDKRRLTDLLTKLEIRHGLVKYYTLKRLREYEPKVEDVPFSKRAAYKDEQEYRALFCSNKEDLTSKDLEIPVAAIERIIVNPWLPEVLVDTVREVINSIPGFDTLEVLQSTVIDGPAWKEFAGRISNQL